MIRHLITTGKAIIFLGLWIFILVISTYQAFDYPAFLPNQAALLRLWLELLPLLGTLFVTGIFVWLVEKNKMEVSLFRNTLKSIGLGMILGVVWLGGTVLVLYLLGSFQLGNKNEVPYLPIWFLAVLLNVIMQEYLVRGYLFSLFKEQYNIIVAIIVTTIFFTAMHGGAFEAGVVPVLNVVTMSIFVSILLIYTESLLAPIIVHFIWNGIGCLVLGGVSLAEDYPSIWNATFTRNSLISGGPAKLEGSIIVLIMNVILIVFMALLLKRRTA